MTAAWRAQCFKKSPVQMWDVSRKEKPATFWFLIGGHLAMVMAGVWLATWKGAVALTALGFQ
ncbi:MAG: hypothetical protein KJ916_14640 [Alphaproteobacteria bacterium]|nr:hypothetical protein [Alphaproteobacteria bacterium]